MSEASCIVKIVDDDGVEHSVKAVCSEFSLADRLPSTPSADGIPSLFGHFVGTTRSSDSLPTFMLDLWFIAFSNRPAHTFVSRVGSASRFSHVEFPGMQGSKTSQSPVDARIPHPLMLPSARATASAL